MLKKNLPVIFIVLVGFIMRIWNIHSMSMSNDELSAIYRLQFDSIFDVWNLGVRLDGHPAFVQTFLYFWLQLFPDTPFFIRLPSVIFSVLSIWIIYKIGKMWFSESAGLFAAMTLAFFEYPILYSQLARPYSYGLFFALWMTLLWSKLIFYPENFKKIDFFQAILATSFAMYTHYFSFFQVLLIGITGFFLLRKNNMYKYMIIIGGVIILFIPHMGITLYQLGVGGVGGWLGKPGHEFIIEYILYAFNHSFFVFSLVGIILIFSFIVKQEYQKEFVLKRILLLTWFLIPYLTGFHYSNSVNPVLQYSVLLFAFPSFILFVFSFVQFAKKKIAFVFMVLFSIVAIATTVLPSERNYYGRYHFAEYHQVALDLVEWKEKYKDDIIEIIIVNNEFYIRYYLKQYSDEEVVDRYYHYIPLHYISFKKFLSDQKSTYLALSFTNIYVLPEIHEMVKEFYPYALDERKYMNAGSYLFSKSESDSLTIYSKFRYQWDSSFTEMCNVNVVQVDSIPFQDTLNGYQDEFLEFKNGNLSDIIQQPWHELIVSVYIKAIDTLCDPSVVLSIDNQEKNVLWTSRSLTQQSINNPLPSWVHLSQRMDHKELNLKTDRYKIYIWNPQKCRYCLEGVKVKIGEGNPILFEYPN